MTLNFLLFLNPSVTYSYLFCTVQLSPVLTYQASRLTSPKRSVALSCCHPLPHNLCPHLRFDLSPLSCPLFLSGLSKSFVETTLIYSFDVPLFNVSFTLQSKVKSLSRPTWDYSRSHVDTLYTDCTMSRPISTSIPPVLLLLVLLLPTDQVNLELL